MSEQPKTLLITPPLVQPNTPYSATPLLCAYLRREGFDARQIDLSLELLLRLFTPEGIEQTRQTLIDGVAGAASDFVVQTPHYQSMIGPVVRFLQGRDPELAWRLARRGELPEGPRLRRAWEAEDDLRAAFGFSAPDLARHLASLFMDDIADAIRFAEPFFGFSRYAEKMAVHLPEFAVMHTEVRERETFVTAWMDELTDRAIEQHRPDLVAITVPFPGTLFGALRIGRRIKQIDPRMHVALGGGYCNTELRTMSDPSVFDLVDTILLDANPLALRRLIEFLAGADEQVLIKTMLRRGDDVVTCDSGETPVPHRNLPPPTCAGLDLKRYFGLVETLNPVTRLWTEGCWNRLMLAHGCPWSRCAFCDTELDCVKRYDPADASTICDWLEAVMAESGRSGFHFVDESLDAQLIESLCNELLERGLQCTWWGNIRFEKRFTPALIGKMAAAGCIAVAGGLETASQRTLKLMRKGINMNSAERVMRDLSEAGILIHAYLMHGFPTQTDEEVLAAEAAVEGLVDQGILHSLHWHRFALSAHSDIARSPARYSIELVEEGTATFARNEIPYRKKLSRTKPQRHKE